MSTVKVERLPLRFERENKWVIALPFFHGGEARVRSIFTRVAELSDADVDKLVQSVYDRFEHRHSNIEQVLEEDYTLAAKMIGQPTPPTLNRQRLIGSYFTMEYAIASAALFNPSIVPDPNQKGIAPGALRFIMSLRATGEGHVSSIVFRRGIIEADGSIHVRPPARQPRRARRSPDQSYIKSLFRRKLREMALDQEATDVVLGRLQDQFTITELEHAIVATQQSKPEVLRLEETLEGIRWLARENYRFRLPDDADISQLVIFPQSDNEIRGIEDLRMVRFVDDDGKVTYFGTYNAYNGYRVLPQLMETSDLHHVQVHTMNGRCAENKGMALFPRRINGHYVMCSRIDGVNLHIMYSDIPQFWENAELLRAPKHPWEFMLIGNCGSPIETSAGWLLLTHGVGPMRTYSIGAMLLDRDNPAKVIGHLDEPLLMPTEDEREGYTPNVVYTCGALVNGDHLYMPYAMSDSATGFAIVELKPLLERLCG
jgi:predicted GH43/DUF377 family glycosyl hydrolase